MLDAFLTDEFRLTLVRRAAATVGLGTYVFGAVTGIPYLRFLGLRSAAERALWRGDLDEAEALAGDLLAMAKRYRRDWNYGNAVHHGHCILGRAELARHRLGPAVEHLRAAGRTPGSPQLNSFGPNMTLAKELLELGEEKAVLDFFDDCARFWRPPGQDALGGPHPLEEWREQVRAGKVPRFGANLAY